MNIVHVVRDLDRASGGPSRSIPAVADALARSGRFSQISVLFLADHGTVPLPHVDKLEFRLCRRISRSLLERVNERRLDLLHLHGLWTWGLHSAVAVARSCRVPYVISPRGMLSDWCVRHKGYRKQAALLLYQRRDLEDAAFLHVTSEDERRDVRRWISHDRVVVVPNGCSMPPSGSVMRPVSDGTRLAVSVCRLHPVKQLDVLIRAWAKLRPQGWRLVIAGPGDAMYRDYLVRLTREHQLEHEIDIGPEVNDKQKWGLLKAASVFVLPSASENFGMSIAEALASGTPVLTTTGTPWGTLTERGCGWICDSSEEGILQSLSTSLSTSALELERMGENGRELIRTEYSWNSVAERLGAHYFSHRRR